MEYIRTFANVSHRQLDLPLWLRYEPNQSEMALHSHEFVELVVITRGRGTHFSRYSEEALGPGSVLAIPQGGMHGYRDTGELSVMNILFDPVTLPLPRLDLHTVPGHTALFLLQEKFFSAKCPYPNFQLSDSQLDYIRWLLDAMLRECADVRPGQKFCLLGIFMAILGALSRWYASDGRARNNPPIRLARVLSHLSTHYHQPVTIEELLPLASMSRSTLLRSFFRATGTTPIHYLLQLRISHAGVLLQESRLSIAEVAFKCGFNDGNYFSRMFRKLTGCTPAEYRRRFPAANS